MSPISKKVDFILMDIEGTTTAVDFVHKVLFPYSAERLPRFVRDHAHEPAVAACLAAARQLVASERGHPPADNAELISIMLGWIADDRKAPPLKDLQGILWRDGYTSGAYTSHLYDDVLPAWRAWLQAGRQLGIYSSGSVPAQKLLFEHTPHGDLTPHLAAYFDTQVGGKREVASYHTIVKQLARPAASILFLSDVVAELEAARTAGLQTAHILRPGTVSVGYQPSFHTFTEITFA